MEQFVRDARINMIYEGTNTIQSLDLLGRKVLGNNGATLKKFGKLIGALVEEEGVNEAMAEFINPLADLGDKITKLTTEIGIQGFPERRRGGRRRGGLPARGRPPGVWLLLCPHGQVALREDRRRQHRPVLPAKLQTARFYFAKLFPETATLMRTARAGWPRS
jgi:hypothetical protein